MCEINWELTFKLGTLIVALGTFIVGSVSLKKALSEYSSSLKWKKAEFLAKEYKEFIDDTFVKRSLAILDGFPIKIHLRKGDIDGTNDFIDYKRENLKKAFTNLSDEDLRPKDEVFIRLFLDRFLFKLGVFQNHIDNKLLFKEAVEPYIIYWIKLIGNDDESVIDRGTKLLIRQFIKEYNYSSTIKLFNTFGFPIS